METTIDAAGRLVVPKRLRDELGLVAGTRLDVSIYGSGLAVVPQGRAARLVREGAHLVASSERRVSEDELFAIIDAGRR